MKSIHLNLMAIVAVVFALGVSARESTAQSNWNNGNAGCSGGQCQGDQANSSQRQSYYPQPAGSCSGGDCKHQLIPHAGSYPGPGTQFNQRSFASTGSYREPRSRPYFDEPRMAPQPSSLYSGSGYGYQSQQPADRAPRLDPRSERRFFGPANMPSGRANPAQTRLQLYTENGLPSQGPLWTEALDARRTNEESRRIAPPRIHAGFSETLPSTPSGLSQSDSTDYLPPPSNNFAVSPLSREPNLPGMSPASPNGADRHDHSKCNHNH
jgi:hypothetical protein